MSIKTISLLALLLMPTACKSNAAMSGSSSTPQATAPSPVAAPTGPVTAPAAAAAATNPATASSAAEAAPSSPNATPNANSAAPLTGLWDAVGYACESGAPEIEVISITQTATQFVGTKITGDNCVPAGYISFQGTITAGTLALQFNEGQPGEAVQLNPATTPGTYTPTLIHIGISGSSGPVLQLQPHQS